MTPRPVKGRTYVDRFSRECVVVWVGEVFATIELQDRHGNVWREFPKLSEWAGTFVSVQAKRPPPAAEARP